MSFQSLDIYTIFSKDEKGVVDVLARGLIGFERAKRVFEEYIEQYSDNTYTSVDCNSEDGSVKISSYNYSILLYFQKEH